MPEEDDQQGENKRDKTEKQMQSVEKESGDNDPQERSNSSQPEITESSAFVIIDSYWGGEAPKEILRKESSKGTGEVEKDW